MALLIVKDHAWFNIIKEQAWFNEGASMIYQWDAWIVYCDQLVGSTLAQLLIMMNTCVW